MAGSEYGYRDRLRAKNGEKEKKINIFSSHDDEHVPR
jgi:hypothetical protein